MTTVTPILSPVPGPWTAQRVPAGTAENLARLTYFSLMDHPQTDELDTVALFLIGDVGPAPAARHLHQRLTDDLLRLWRLITADWLDTDLDDDPDDLDHYRTYGAYLEHRRDVTVDRLTHDLEQTIQQHRINAAADRRLHGTSGRPA